MKIKEIAISLFALAMLGTIAFLWLGPSGLQPAPTVSFTSLDGKQVSLEQLRGKPVLLAFWATTCPGCIKEIPQLVELHKEYASRGLTVIGVAMAYDPIEQIRQMVGERKMPYTIAHDKSGTVAEAFGGISLTPTTLLINPQGQITQKTLGDLDMQILHRRIKQML